MDKQEQIIHLWFDMWLQKKDLGIETVFAPNATYIESWGPEYHGVDKIAHWFQEWNSRATVLRWDIKQFFHRKDQTVVEWYFQCVQAGESPTTFEGVTLVRWSPDGKIVRLQEFGCNLDRYDPYQDGPEPKLRNETAAWF